MEVAPWPLYPGERAISIHWTGSWVGPKTGLNAVAVKRKDPCSCQELDPSHSLCSLVTAWLPSWYSAKQKDNFTIILLQ